MIAVSTTSLHNLHSLLRQFLFGILNLIVVDCYVIYSMLSHAHDRLVILLADEIPVIA